MFSLNDLYQFEFEFSIERSPVDKPKAIEQILEKIPVGSFKTKRFTGARVLLDKIGEAMPIAIYEKHYEKMHIFPNSLQLNIMKPDEEFSYSEEEKEEEKFMDLFSSENLNLLSQDVNFLTGTLRGLFGDEPSKFKTELTISLSKIGDPFKFNNLYQSTYIDSLRCFADKPQLYGMEVTIEDAVMESKAITHIRIGHATKKIRGRIVSEINEAVPTDFQKIINDRIDRINKFVEISKV